MPTSPVRDVFYKPTVGSTLRELRQDLPSLLDPVDICIDHHVRPKGQIVVSPRKHHVELLIVDEADRRLSVSVKVRRQRCRSDSGGNRHHRSKPLFMHSRRRLLEVEPGSSFPCPSRYA